MDPVPSGTSSSEPRASAPSYQARWNMLSLTQWLRGEKEPRPKAPRQCLCCGQCCEAFGGHLEASEADLERWRRLGREDLLRRVSGIGWIWIDPETGKLEDDCPFLERVSPERALCSIQEIKPDICRDYPTIAHGNACLRGVFL